MKRQNCGPPRFALAITAAKVAGGKDATLDKHDANAGQASTENKADADGAEKN